MSFWQECQKTDAGPLQCITSEGSQCKCVNSHHLVLERCFLKGQRIPLGSLKSHLCLRRQFLQPGNQHLSLILSLSLSALASSPSSLHGSPSLQSSGNRVGDMTYTTHRDCCIGDLCNCTVARTVAPACILATAATTLAWVSQGLRRG